MLALLMVVGVTVWSSGPANAAIYWYGITLDDQMTGRCATADVSNYSVDMEDCHDRPSQKWDLVSSAPDAGGHAYVEIRPSGINECLTTLGAGTGPLANSSRVVLSLCYGGPNQIWAMSTAYPPQYNQHYIQFFSFGDRVCLDGGIGLYGYREEGCVPGNWYQLWNIMH
ncbi:MAG: hypothetical protein HOV87_27355 [Catenulispora sp.]|nr:hypothetical protein [Catenulispora sp.]